MILVSFNHFASSDFNVWLWSWLWNQVILCLDDSSNMLAICDKVKLILNYYRVGDI